MSMIHFRNQRQCKKSVSPPLVFVLFCYAFLEQVHSEISQYLNDYLFKSQSDVLEVDIYVILFG